MAKELAFVLHTNLGPAFEIRSTEYQAIFLLMGGLGDPLGARQAENKSKPGYSAYPRFDKGGLANSR